MENIYKQAAMLALRIETNKGSLSVEQLWTLKLTELDQLAVSLEESMEKSSTKSFLKATTKANQLAKLKFDIVLDVLTTKKEAQEAASTAAEKKAHNDKILALIAQKEEGKLQEMSVEQLTAMLK
jgi:hypothetical protein